MHPAGSDHRGPGIGRRDGIQEENQCSSRAAGIGNLDAVDPNGWLHEPATLLEFRRPGGQPRRTPARYDQGRFCCYWRLCRSGVCRMVCRLERLCPSFGIAVGAHDVERDRSLVMNAGEEPAAIHLQKHSGQYGTWLALPPRGCVALALERHATAAMGGEFENDLVLRTRVGHSGTDLSNPRAGDGCGNELSRRCDVIRIEKMEEACFEGLHGAYRGTNGAEGAARDDPGREACQCNASGWSPEKNLGLRDFSRRFSPERPDGLIRWNALGLQTPRRCLQGGCQWNRLPGLVLPAGGLEWSLSPP